MTTGTPEPLEVGQRYACVRGIHEGEAVRLHKVMTNFVFYQPVKNGKRSGYSRDRMSKVSREVFERFYRRV